MSASGSVRTAGSVASRVVMGAAKQKIALPSDASVTLEYMLFNPESTATPLVMVQGLSGLKEDWRSLSQELSRVRPVLVYDNRGMGGSSIPEGPYTMDDMAKDCVALVQHLGFKKFDLMGISMGGMIAQTVAAIAPGVQRVVLGCTHKGGHGILPPDTSFVEALGPREPTMTKREYTARLVACNYTPRWIDVNRKKFEAIVDETLEGYRPFRGLSSQMSAIMDWDGVAPLKAPILILHGTDDAVIPVENGEELAKHHVSAHFLKLQGAGHVFWDMDGGLSADIVDAFLGGRLHARL